jgi:hypothetical protein
MLGRPERASLSMPAVAHTAALSRMWLPFPPRGLWMWLRGRPIAPTRPVRGPRRTRLSPHPAGRSVAMESGTFRLRRGRPDIGPASTGDPAAPTPDASE